MSPFDSTQLIIGATPQFFFDNLVIEQTQDITRVFHSPRKEPQPVIQRDRPWERNLYITVNGWNVIRDRHTNLLRCWYDDWKPDPQEVKRLGYLPFVYGRTMLATSTDGLHWEKPELDYDSYEGRKTNIVSGRDDFRKLDSTNVFEDLLDPDRNRRFKMLLDRHFDPKVDQCSDAMLESIRKSISAEVMQTRDGRDGLTERVQVEVHSSPDGIHWTPMPDLPRFGQYGNGLGDCYSVFPDVDCGVYRMLTRSAGMETIHYPANRPRTSSFFPPNFPGDVGRMNLRRVFHSQSADLHHWSRPQPVVTPDPSIDNLDDSYYGMNQFKMGDMYVGFMNVLHQVENTIDVRLMFSRDGINWEQANHRQSWLSPSPGAWDGFMVNINSAPVLMGDEMYVYYGGANCRHDWWITGLREGLTVPEALNPDLVRFGLGVARMRRDGFVSLDAGSVREGVLITRTVRTELLRLSLNAVCRRAGFVKVEVTDADDRVIPGFSREECDVIDGDSTNAAVTWRGKREIPHGGSLRLRLFMRDASLYSFMFS